MIVVEGNIGVGKTTFMNVFENMASPLHEITEVIHEPIDQWRNLEGFNALQLFYDSPKDHGYIFENIAFSTIVDAQLAPLSLGKHVRLMERSIWSAFHVFSKSLYKNLHINQFEFAALKTSFDLLCNKLVGSRPGKIIYLSCPPKVLKNRIESRNRVEEGVIPLHYLQQLDELYDEWIDFEVQRGTHVFKIDTNKPESVMRSEFLYVIRALTVEK